MMNKKLKIVIILLLLIVVSVTGVWKYVNKASVDYSEQTPISTYTFKQLTDKANQNDTASLKKLIDQLISVNGTVKKINKDSLTTTVELSDTTCNTSVICQIDNRHQGECAVLKEGQAVCIKGKLCGYNIDTDLGLGNTLQMNYCSLDKQTKK